MASKLFANKRWILLISILMFLVWNIISWQFPFFWDTVLNSKIAHWYLDTNFNRLMVPENLDAGHPPFFSLYLALCWKTFGQSLAMSHLAMLPFLLGICWNWWKLCQRFLSESFWLPGMLIIWLQPTMLAQSGMVNPDIALLCMLLIALNAVLEQKYPILMLAAVAMCMVTFRGILMVPIFFLIDFTLHKGWQSWPISFRKLIYYVPVSVLVASWLFYHLQAQGWLFTPPPETYGGHREVLGLGGILKNFGILAWRMLDFGMITVWGLVACITLFKHKKLKSIPAYRVLGPALVISFGWLAMLMLPFSNPIGHRYFLFQQLLLCLFGLWLVDQLWQDMKRVWVPTLVGLALLSGHFWVYPVHIAQGWDGSLSHVAFFALQKELEADMAGEEFGEGPICSDFPLLGDERYRYVIKEPGHRLVSKDAAPWANCACVVQAQVSNGFSDAELSELGDPGIWMLKKEYAAWQQWVRVYRRVED